jgi:hypothetical protein
MSAALGAAAVARATTTVLLDRLAMGLRNRSGADKFDCGGDSDGDASDSDDSDCDETNGDSPASDSSGSDTTGSGAKQLVRVEPAVTTAGRYKA